MSAHVAGETHEAFLLFLFAGDTDLLGVDDHDEVTSIDMRRENCFLFAAQKSRRLDRHVAQHLILGIDQPPLAVDFVGFGGKRLHRRLKKGTEATGREGHCQPAESGAALVSRGIVLTLIVDDGVRSRDHRKNIFNPSSIMRVLRLARTRDIAPCAASILRAVMPNEPRRWSRGTHKPVELGLVDRLPAPLDSAAIWCRDLVQDRLN